MGDLRRCLSPLILRRVGIDGLVVEQVPLGIQTDNLAPRTEAWVYSQYPLLSQRGSQQQLPQVLGKDPDGFLVGLRLALAGKLALYAWLQETLQGVGHGKGDLAGRPIAAFHEPMLQSRATFLRIR